MSKNKSIIKSTRKIKCLGNCIEPGEKYLHPITLAFSTNNSTTQNYCPSEFHYDRDGPTYSKVCKNTNISSFDIQKFMALPYLNLNIEQILDMYKITGIESLILWVDNMISEKLPFQYINRIINVWIKSNYDILIKNNNIMVDIYSKINKSYWKKEFIVDDIKKYIKKWFKNKNYDNFFLDLGNDIYHNF